MIEVKNLTKIFERQKAVDHITFTVRPGEVLGFLGPNGAGKSTTMRMVTGYLPPTAGTARVGGADVITAPLAARRKIGYLPESAPAYKDMSVTGFLDFIAEIRGFSGKAKRRRISETMERCFLSNVRYQTIGTLSKGYNQRVCFAQCLLHDPEYLIMDEPTDGLDPNQKREVRDMIREIGKTKTIILSTHNLEEVDAVCTRVLIIDKGKLLVDDTPEGLKTRSDTHGAIRFTLRTAKLADPLRELEKIPGVSRAEVLSIKEDGWTMRAFPGGKTASVAEAIFRHFAAKGCPVETLFMEEGRLDDVFREITLGDT